MAWLWQPGTSSADLRTMTDQAIPLGESPGPQRAEQPPFSRALVIATLALAMGVTINTDQIGTTFGVNLT